MEDKKVFKGFDTDIHTIQEVNAFILDDEVEVIEAYSVSDIKLGNNTLNIISGENVKELKDSALANATNLSVASFKNLEKVGAYAYKNTQVDRVDLNLNTVTDPDAFEGSKIKHLVYHVNGKKLLIDSKEGFEGIHHISKTVHHIVTKGEENNTLIIGNKMYTGERNYLEAAMKETFQSHFDKGINFIGWQFNRPVYKFKGNYLTVTYDAQNLTLNYDFDVSNDFDGNNGFATFREPIDDYGPTENALDGTNTKTITFKTNKEGTKNFTIKSKKTFLNVYKVNADNFMVQDSDSEAYVYEDGKLRKTTLFDAVIFFEGKQAEIDNSNNR